MEALLPRGWLRQGSRCPSSQKRLKRWLIPLEVVEEVVASWGFELVVLEHLEEELVRARDSGFLYLLLMTAGALLRMQSVVVLLSQVFETVYSSRSWA